MYSLAPHNDASVNDGPHMLQWSHSIKQHCVTIAYSISYSNMLYIFVA